MTPVGIDVWSSSPGDKLDGLALGVSVATGMIVMLLEMSCFGR